MKKNLSILIYSLAGGGAERVVSVLLNQLKDRYHISLVLMRNKIDYDIPEEIDVYFLEDSSPYEYGLKKFFKLPFLALKYKSLCKKHNIDITLAFMNRPSYVAVLAKMFGLKTHTIISERTTPSLMYRSKTLQSKISRMLIRWLYPKADYIIANSQGNKQDLIENFSIDRDSIGVIYNPFDLKKIEECSQAEVSGMSFDKFTFVTVGRLDHGKNHQLLINAFSKLRKENIQLIIVGEGILYRRLEKQIEAMGLKDRVFLIGFDKNPYRYLSRSNVFVFSSLYEGFPNVLVEALACGLPVISTDCKSGPSEILSPDTQLESSLHEGLRLVEYGILVPVHNAEELSQAMKMFLQDQKLCQEYADRAHKRAKDFQLESITNQYIDVLENK